jgi:hypothetical protein
MLLAGKVTASRHSTPLSVAVQYTRPALISRPLKMLASADTIQRASGTVLVSIFGVNDAIWRRAPAPTQAGGA